MLQGSHEATAAQWNDCIIVVFSHQPSEPNSERNNGDHMMSFSGEQNYLRRASSDTHRLFCSAPLLSVHILPAPEIGHNAAVPSNPSADHSPQLLALRTIVLMV